MTKTISITIDKGGHAKINTEGFSGGECLKAAAPFKAIFGEKESEKMTEEFHQPEQIQGQEQVTA